MITELPLSLIYNTMLTYIDHLTKLYLLNLCYMGCSYIDVREVAQYFFDTVICHCDVPSSVVHDHDQHCINTFQIILCSIIGAK